MFLVVLLGILDLFSLYMSFRDDLIRISDNEITIIPALPGLSGYCYSIGDIIEVSAYIPAFTNMMTFSSGRIWIRIDFGYRAFTFPLPLNIEKKKVNEIMRYLQSRNPDISVKDDI